MRNDDVLAAFDGFDQAESKLGVTHGFEMLIQIVPANLQASSLHVYCLVRRFNRPCRPATSGRQSQVAQSLS
jgi:hypothetical protein